ncbi:hypothetical protein GGR56DRAFT_155051 [Xylariaceae sp. FL0804]|nr:hypothetical protein GGR56DRAFT_155051 [Xylariaceae sp. FL0804]
MQMGDDEGGNWAVEALHVEESVPRMPKHFCPPASRSSGRAVAVASGRGNHRTNVSADTVNIRVVHNHHHHHRHHHSRRRRQGHSCVSSGPCAGMSSSPSRSSTPEREAIRQHPRLEQYGRVPESRPRGWGPLISFERCPRPSRALAVTFTVVLVVVLALLLYVVFRSVTRSGCGDGPSTTATTSPMREKVLAQRRQGQPGQQETATSVTRWLPVSISLPPLSHAVSQPIQQPSP